MIEDARRLPSGARVEADVCVIGGGPAGLSLALELRGCGLTTAVLEAGGRRPDRRTQSLLRGEGAYPGGTLDETRLAALGGTTRVWSGWCRPIERAAFAPRPGVIDIGWPFDREHLDAFYARAHALCGLGPYDYRPDGWDGPAAPLPLSGGHIRTRLYQMSPPTRFGDAFAGALSEAPELRVLLHAVCAGLATDPRRRRVEAARFATLAGGRHEVRARWFVLAAGGVENARLLLLSGDGGEPALGDSHGLVGRFFMEHPYVTAGWLHVDGGDRAAGEAGPLDFYVPHESRRDGATATIRGVLTPSPALVREEGLLTSAFFPLPAWESAPAVSSRGGEALRTLAAAWRRGVWSGGAGAALLRAGGDPVGALGALHHRLLRPRLGRPAPGTIRIRGFCESQPRASERVVLAGSRDRLGRPHARVDWAPSPLALASLARGYELLADAFRAAGVGHLEWTLDPARVTIEGGRHHMGTTRMHPDPARGVVDADGRVHETENLFVSGSSVFPTAGFANPTLTIVALALRLADHLRSLARAR